MTYKTEGIYISSVILAYIVVIILAMVYFPVTYSMLRFHISALGGLARNPEGNLIYNIGIFWIGIAIFPHLKYIFKNLEKLHFKISKVGIWFGGIGCIGFSGLGIFPEDVGILHKIFALSSVIGFISIAVGIYILTIKSAKVRFSFNSIFLFQLLTGFVILATILVIVMPISDIIAVKWGLPLALFEFSPYEWLTLISITTWILGMTGVVSRFSQQDHKDLTQHQTEIHSLVLSPGLSSVGKD